MAFTATQISSICSTFIAGEPPARLAQPSRSASTSRKSRSIIKPPTTTALFGWGQKKDEGVKPKKMDRRERERLEMIEALKAKVEDRRAGNKKSRAQVAERRAKVTQYLRDPEVKKAVDDERRERTQKMKGPDAPNFGIIVPMAPFGIPEYDNGERFDLALPHVDEGYVDEDADVLGKFGKLFGGGKKDKK